MVSERLRAARTRARGGRPLRRGGGCAAPRDLRRADELRALARPRPCPDRARRDRRRRRRLRACSCAAPGLGGLRNCPESQTSLARPPLRRRRPTTAAATHAPAIATIARITPIGSAHAL